MYSQYISLDVLASRLALPRTYLRDLVATKDIPFLNVRGRKRFDEQQVREALRTLAARKESVRCSA
jgi:excisionase family DNA binding protein